jgi:FlaA1/EpsC-like NDP-sugar epimerase
MLSWQPIVLMLADLGCLAASVALALILRFDSQVPAQAWRPLWTAFPPGAILFVLSFRFFNLYRQAWRFAGIETAVAVVKGTTLGLAGVVACQALITGHTFPRGVVVITWLLALGLSAALLLTFSLQTHSSASDPFTGTLLDWGHLLAMGIWLGGLLPLALALRAARRGAAVTLPAL